MTPIRRRPKLNIAHKLPAIMVAMALLVGLGVGGGAFAIAAHLAEKQAESRLSAVAQLKRDNIDAYFDSLAGELAAFAQRTDTTSAVSLMSSAYGEIAFMDDAASVLQNAYIAANPHSAQERFLLDSNELGGPYDKYHKLFHPHFRELAEQRPYEDIYLFDARGNMI